MVLLTVTTLQIPILACLWWGDHKASLQQRQVMQYTRSLYTHTSNADVVVCPVDLVVSTANWPMCIATSILTPKLEVVVGRCS